jgi:hypothetical protein
VDGEGGFGEGAHGGEQECEAACVVEVSVTSLAVDVAVRGASCRIHEVLPHKKGAPQEKEAKERSDISPQSRLVAGLVLIIVPTVEIGKASILTLLVADPSYARTTSGRTSGEQDMPTRACGWCFLWWPCAAWTRRPSLRGTHVGGCAQRLSMYYVNKSWTRSHGVSSLLH